jgi:chromate transporter
MSFLVIYLLLLKATLSSFSGLAALPIVRNDFVVKRHLLTDHQLNTALVVGRSTPGPKGHYLVSVGYYAGGTLGGIAAWLAIVTPAGLVVPLLIFARRKSKIRG